MFSNTWWQSLYSRDDIEAPSVTKAAVSVLCKMVIYPWSLVHVCLEPSRLYSIIVSHSPSEEPLLGTALRLLATLAALPAPAVAARLPVRFPSGV
jgi:hypothetical protein